MSVTAQQCEKAIIYLTSVGLGRPETLDGKAMADALNYAPLTSKPSEYKLLNPTDEELAPACRWVATRCETSFFNVQHLAEAIREMRHGNRALRAARIEKDLLDNGPEPVSPISDASKDVAWRKAYTKAIADGLNRGQAISHAWDSVGMTPPDPGKPIPREKVQQLIASLTHTPHQIATK